ncbi:DUF2252 family protein [Endozoicomonas sp. SM1973]|uniref:DUF2252 family protein n=1 Tax=Spartinivicinus marinus TaxID=2994442 RepID=A0A853HUT7_9GAMM|nr:DUF2252 family protein [Spartinivicinus marinus]MCX4028887.1 DUF2252 family protein [Spartinivicinus marinus]NYZ65530.1 DUF2252 family protein [Spartinivicinus marinus]
MKVLHTRQSHVVKQINQFNQQASDADRRLKFEKMQASAFVFFRGTNHIYWHDVSRDWRISLYGGRPETQVWLQGDAHVYNFGALHDHHGQIYYGMDDFDDAIIADYQFDLWRLATSLVLDLQQHDYYQQDLAEQAVQRLGKAYLQGVVASKTDDSAIYIENAVKPIKKFLTKVHQKNTRLNMLQKWTTSDLNRFNYANPKLTELSDHVKTNLTGALLDYHRSQQSITPDFTSRFEVVDLVKRVKAGTGSLGNQRFYALIQGPTPEENIILDIKQQQQPAAIRCFPKIEQHWYYSQFTNEGQRHADAYSAIAEHPDAWLGWLSYNDELYSVRERSPFKKDFPTHKLFKPKHYLTMAEIWGEILGKEHARGSIQVQEPNHRFIHYVKNELMEHQKEFIKLLSAVSVHYARCVVQDWGYFRNSGLW